MSASKLSKLAVEFNSVDVSTDPAALETVKSLGYSSLPVIIVRNDDDTESHWSGYQPDRLSALAA